jgi:mannan endo-1,6-alpha-mannosidase
MVLVSTLLPLNFRSTSIVTRFRFLPLNNNYDGAQVCLASRSTVLCELCRRNRSRCRECWYDQSIETQALQPLMYADSIKTVAKTLASSIVASYKSQSDIPGLFQDPYFWWEAGTVWNGLVEYSHLTKDAQFNDLVAEALEFQVGSERNYMPANQTKTLGNEDQSVWALAALAAAEVGFPKPKQGQWVDLAQSVFDNQVLRWDEETCGGGLRWQIFTFNKGYDYKNSFTAANFFLLSSRLARLTGNSTYRDWAGKAFKWSQDVGFIDNSFHVFDGADTNTDCKKINHLQWSYPHSVYTEGAAIMYNLVGYLCALH